MPQEQNLNILKRYYTAVEDAGADYINVPDTVGVMIPSSMKYLISELKKIHYDSN